MAKYTERNGESPIEVDLKGMELYKEAADKKVSVRELVNIKYPVADGMPDAFKQMCGHAGLQFEQNKITGVPAANLKDVLDPSGIDAAGNYTSQPAVPDSRLLFPAAVLEVMENKMGTKEDEATNAFESLVGYRKTIATSKFEQPILDYTGARGPEDSQFERIGQNTLPAIMLSLKASDISRKVPTTSIGMEISYEALASNSLDFIAMTLARFYKKADYAEWCTQLGFILSGDSDAATTTFSAGKSALSSITAQSLDSAVTVAGTISQKAYLKFLYLNIMYLNKTHFVLDFDTAYALDIRSNRPTNVQNNSTDRLDVPFEVVFPMFNKTIKLLIMPAGTWAANTIMALDQAAPALAKITSSFAEYQAVEDIVMKKSKQLRVDRGFLTYRVWDQAFNVMTLTVA